MVDRISFGKGLGPITALDSPMKNTPSKSEADKTRPDRVDFSSVLQEASKAREVAAPENTERSKKLASLQSQIASGSYSPDLEKVAESLLDFLGGMK